MSLDNLIPVLIPLVIAVIGFVVNRKSQQAKAERDRGELEALNVSMANETNELVRTSYAEVLALQQARSAQAESELERLKADMAGMRAELVSLRADVERERRRFDTLWRWSQRAIEQMHNAGIEAPPLPEEELH